MEEIEELNNKLDELRDKADTAIEFIKSLEKIAYDAWKPVQITRSDNEVAEDDVRKEVLDSVWDEAKAVLCSINELDN